MATPSIARKNQIANGIAASTPANPDGIGFVRKFSILKPGATTAMNTSNSATASTVTKSSKRIACFTPRMLSQTKTMNAAIPTA